MKEVAFLSGKGGTGKTSLTASFAVLAGNPVIADCDVDAPDLHILLHPEVLEVEEFEGPQLAEIDREQCVECGLCQEACRFEAIAEFSVAPILCEGCGTCLLVCPENAIALKKRVAGEAYISKTEYGWMAHALLFPGESNSGKLVTLVKQNARKIAERENCDLILVDGPPGIGCPAIASVGGVDLGVIVAEPTVSGIHDMKRALQLLAHFKIVPVVCINKHDINDENTRKIERFCRNRKIDVVGKISFNPIVTEALVSEEPVVQFCMENLASQEIIETWKQIFERLKS